MLLKYCGCSFPVISRKHNLIADFLVFSLLLYNIHRAIGSGFLLLMCLLGWIPHNPLISHQFAAVYFLLFVFIFIIDVFIVENYTLKHSLLTFVLMDFGFDLTSERSLFLALGLQDLSWLCVLCFIFKYINHSELTIV